MRTKSFRNAAEVCRDTSRREVERYVATDVFADYAADDAEKLADLLMDADDKQFAVIFPKLKDHGETGLALLTKEIALTLPVEHPSSDERREKLAKRQANAAVALLRMNQPEMIWPLLNRRDKPDDPRVRSYLIHRFARSAPMPGPSSNGSTRRPELAIRRALILSSGEFADSQFSAAERIAVVEKLKEAYRTEADPGLHASAEWLLRRWNEEKWLRKPTPTGRRMTSVRSDWLTLRNCRQSLRKHRNGMSIVSGRPR